MRTLLSIVGIVLVIAGIFLYTYHGISYNTQDKVAQIGGVNITAQTQKTITVPPIAAGLSIVAGLVLVVIGRFK